MQKSVGAVSKAPRCCVICEFPFFQISFETPSCVEKKLSCFVSKLKQELLCHGLSPVGKNTLKPSVLNRWWS